MLLNAAVDVFKDYPEFQPLVEEARFHAMGVVLGCEPHLADGVTSINTIIHLLLQFIPLVADSIASSVKLLRSDHQAATLELKRTLCLLENTLVEVDLAAEEEFQYRASDIICNRGTLSSLPDHWHTVLL